MRKFKVKPTLITGGTTGMCYATAQRFLIESTRLIMTGRIENSITQTLLFL